MKQNYLLLLFGFGLLLTSCGSETPDDKEGEELITTLRLHFTETNSGDHVHFTFQDLDGDGGNAATVDNIVLNSNSTYDVNVELLNESEDPAEDITEEIKMEKEEHQFFFSSDLTGLSFSYSDLDANNNPVGLQFQLNTESAENGSFVVTLKHEPVKDAEGVSNGDITNAEGETDIEVNFPIEVQ